MTFVVKMTNLIWVIIDMSVLTINLLIYDQKLAESDRKKISSGWNDRQKSTSDCSGREGVYRYFKGGGLDIKSDSGGMRRTNILFRLGSVDWKDRAIRDQRRQRGYDRGTWRSHRRSLRY